MFPERSTRLSFPRPALFPRVLLTFLTFPSSLQSFHSPLFDAWSSPPQLRRNPAVFRVARPSPESFFLFPFTSAVLESFWRFRQKPASGFSVFFSGAHARLFHSSLRFFYGRQTSPLNFRVGPLFRFFPTPTSDGFVLARLSSGRWFSRFRASPATKHSHEF